MILTRSPRLDLSSSRTGFIILQGPHHSAWKSRRVGVSLFINSEKEEFAIISYFLTFGKNYSNENGNANRHGREGGATGAKFLILSIRCVLCAFLASVAVMDFISAPATTHP